jgi:protein-S-isoprenylcysteine O-methyltransferase Ste14
MDSFAYTQIWKSGLAFLVAGAIILPLVRREYLKNGKLSHFIALLQLVLWFFFHAFLALTIFGDLWPPMEAYTLKYPTGGILMLIGIFVCIAGMWSFRSMTKVTGRETNQLVVRGVYRCSRNPQYLGYGLVILGVVIGYWSSTAWLAFIAYALLVYATVRIEEEHLTKAFGDEYQDYCRQMPRFLGFRKQ